MKKVFILYQLPFVYVWVSICSINKEGFMKEKKKRLSKANIIGSITMKTLIVFVFAATFFISSIHYGATAAATTPSTGLFFYPPFITVDIFFSYLNEHIY